MRWRLFGRAALSLLLAAVMLLGTLPSFMPVSAADDSELVLRVSEDSAFKDVDTIGGSIAWPITQNKQIQITANFATSGDEKTREVIVEIPRGYKVLEYTAASSTTSIDGVDKLVLSETYNNMITSSTLTARDGSSWIDQGINDYVIMNGTYPNYRVYDGKIVYIFNSLCNNITLTISLGLDAYVMPRKATTATLAPITVTMKSGGDTFTKTLTTTVTNLIVSILGNSPSSLVGTVDGSDTNKGTLPELTTKHTISNSSYAFSSYHLAESAKIVVTYPAGVTFMGFSDGISSSTVGRQDVDASSFTSGVYASGHLSVTLDKDNRTITFEYTKVRIYHSNSLSCYWAVGNNEVDDITVKWNDVLPFKVTFDVSSGYQAIGVSEAHAQLEYDLNVRIVKPSIGTITNFSGLNISRADLNAYADQAYPYDYKLGGFRMQITGSDSQSNLHDLMFRYEFDANLHVRGVALPGIGRTNAGEHNETQASNYTRILAVTSTGRVIELGPYSITNGSLLRPGLTVTSLMLGLENDEYLVSLDAWLDVLNFGNYAHSYNRNSMAYFGRFQNGQQGYVTMAIFDVADSDNPVLLARATDYTTIARTDQYYGQTIPSVSPNTASFYPGDVIEFTSEWLTYSTGGEPPRTTNDGIDPVIYICLPEGIDLDPSSVMGFSVSGNNRGLDWFPLRSVPLPLDRSKFTDENGITWNVYAFTSVNKLDMVARSNSDFGSVLQPAGFDRMKVRFTANVSLACKTYTGIYAKEIVLWDFGVSVYTRPLTAPPDTEYQGRSGDKYGITGNNIDYYLSVASNNTAYNIVQQPGLRVNIGIRTYEEPPNPNPFYTYNGTRASIAPVTGDASAEIWIEYINYDEQPYMAGTEIYLPIPKKGHAYDAYFNCTDVNPAESGGSIAEPKWSGYLTGPIVLPGFTTYYTYDTTFITRPVPQNGSWTPDNDYVWLLGTEVESDNGWADVTMVKFIANADIASGASDSTTFTISVDADAKLGDVNYWRNYQKGWLEVGDGSWAYGSVVAAEISMSGIEGMFFLDENTNGQKDIGENFDPTATGAIFRAVLTEESGGIYPLILTIDNTGRFRSLNANGTQYFLKTGNYLITFHNDTNGSYYFTPVSIDPPVGEQSASSAGNWYMDVQQEDISLDQGSATFSFVVDSEMSTEMTMYVGVGVRNSWTVTYSNGTGSQFPEPATELVPDGQKPKSIPSISGTNVKPGYNSSSVLWTLNKDVEISVSSGSSTTFEAGTPITTSQLGSVIVSADLEATANLMPISYTIAYDGLEGSDFDPVNPNPASYNTVEYTFPIDISNPTKAGYAFTGWTATYSDGTPPITTPTTTYSIPSGTTGNITLTANWSITDYTIIFDNGYNNTTISTVNNAHIDDVITPPSPTRTSFTLLGWSKTTGGAVAYDGAFFLDEDAVNDLFPGTNTSATLYAVWSPVDYTISYNLNGGTNNPSNPISYNVEDTFPIGISNPTRAGHNLTGWTATYSDGTPPTTTPTTTFSIPSGTTGNITLTANWDLVPVTTTPPATTTKTGPTVIATTPITTTSATITTSTTTTPTTSPTTATTTSPTTATTTPTTSATVTTSTTTTTPTTSPTTATTTSPTTTPTTSATITTTTTTTTPTTSPTTATTPTTTPTDKWALVNLILCSAGGLLALFAVIRAILWTGKKKGESYNERRSIGILWIVLAIILAVAGIVLFFVTEDMQQQMGLIDIWTVVNAVIFIAGILCVLLSFKQKAESQ